MFVLDALKEIGGEIFLITVVVLVAIKQGYFNNREEW